MFRSVCCLLLLATPIFGQLNRNGDFHIWNSTMLNFKTVKKGFSFRFIGEERWGDNASRLHYGYAQLQAVWANKYVEIAPGYRQAFSLSNGKWIPAYLSLADVTFFIPSAGDFSKGSAWKKKFFCFNWNILSPAWAWDDRNRFSYHKPDNGPGFWVYRNRLKLVSPEITFFFKTCFVVYDEAFFRERVGFDQNRLGVGFYKKFNECVNCYFVYIYRSLRLTGIWTYQNVLAVYSTFNF